VDTVDSTAAVDIPVERTAAEGTVVSGTMAGWDTAAVVRTVAAEDKHEAVGAGTRLLGAEDKSAVAGEIPTAVDMASGP